MVNNTAKAHLFWGGTDLFLCLFQAKKGELSPAARFEVKNALNQISTGAPWSQTQLGKRATLPLTF